MFTGTFPFFEGIVESRNDPLGLGRVRVRIFSKHTQDKSEIPTDSLPWAIVNMFANSGTGDGPPVGLVEGTVVFGYFRDGEACQHPVIIGGYAGIPTEKRPSSKGFSDPNGVYPLTLNQPDLPPTTRGETAGTAHETIIEGKVTSVPVAGDNGTWDERTSEVAAKHPFNHVRQSESGHLIEMDDTFGAERLTFIHRLGTGLQLLKDGAGNYHIVGEDYHIALGNRNLFVKGNLNLTAVGNVNILGVGGVNIDTEGKLNVRANGGINMQSQAPIIINGAIVDVGPVTAINAGTPPPLPPLVVNDANADVAEARNNVLAQIGVELFGTRSLSDGEVDTVPVLSEESVAAIENELVNTPELAGVVDTSKPPAVSKIPEKIVAALGTEIPPVDYKLKLSKHFSLGDLVKYNVQFKQHDLNSLKGRGWKTDGGLDVSEVVFNLKGLATNILDPLLEQYPDMRVNCAWRDEGGKSQHPKGQAADLQWPNKSLKEHYEIAQWIKANLPFDQMILEHGPVSFWIHVSFVKGGRKQILSFLDPSVGRWPSSFSASGAGYAPTLAIASHIPKFSNPTGMKPAGGDLGIVRKPTGPKYV